MVDRFEPTQLVTQPSQLKVQLPPKFRDLSLFRVAGELLMGQTGIMRLDRLPARLNPGEDRRGSGGDFNEALLKSVGLHAGVVVRHFLNPVVHACSPYTMA